ncbi:MAG: hypothetical protein E5V49_07120 [Mesorhizobium sp.]|nr:hypothetical protein EN848_26315 [bacterium M00.F.Ca.ET.205.01.1.1]TGU48450.1 hypothetical protein EN795_27595 [bacterium M00.F.Ca.ET.152.01.1.1]TGV32708.1 hypothetical protein EN829_027140 [Mesorhizobium sp. M00.F.Ca.ET.186.01.1.1]TGZ39966.1 hypothetical protein EN805_26990 [bacterium M00.F.Ca.ET.162.01.1.1]TJW33675.1 MAG: hypothetical protein E5V49_07120 [Mesorhizobium sp.]
MKVVILSMIGLLEGTNLSFALNYCKPDYERCRQAMEPPTALHLFMLIAGLFACALAFRAIAWVWQWLRANRRSLFLDLGGFLLPVRMMVAVVHF